MPPMLRTSVVVLFIALVALPWAVSGIAERQSLAAKDALLKACLDSGKNATWTSETTFLSTSIEVTCTDPDVSR
jgi:hypothetical protein